MGPRVPLELQRVFLASNGASNAAGDVIGIEAIKAPKNRSAFMVFKRALGGFRGRGKKKNSGSKNSKNDETSNNDARNALLRGVSMHSTAETVAMNLTDHSGGAGGGGSSFLRLSSQRLVVEPIPEHPAPAAAAAPSTPHHHLQRMLQDRGYHTTRVAVLSTSYFNKPSPTQLASFHPRLVDDVIKAENEPELRTLLQAGLHPNACTTHGESLLHRAARLGYHRQLKIFLEFGADVHIADTMGRTLLHDTCYGTRPSFQTFTLLVYRDPTLLFLADRGGKCPLDYVRRDHYAFWLDFLDRTVDELFPRLEQPQTTRSPRLSEKPYSRPIANTSRQLPIDMARMLASGRMTAEEITELMLEETEEDTFGYDDDEDDDDLEESFSCDYGQ